MSLADTTGGKRAAQFRRLMAVAVSAEMIYQLTGSNMSSPQTAELNAGARAPTISKWVNITNIEALGWIIFLSLLDGSGWPVVGGGLAWGGMWAKYKYAIQAGLKSNAPPTEDYKFTKGAARGRSRIPQ